MMEHIKGYNRLIKKVINLGGLVIVSGLGYYLLISNNKKETLENALSARVTTCEQYFANLSLEKKKELLAQEVYTGPKAKELNPPRLTFEIANELEGAEQFALGRGPDFAGHFGAATFSCGTGCQNLVLVDVITGKTLAMLSDASTGYDYSTTSTILIQNPKVSESDLLAMKEVYGDSWIFQKTERVYYQVKENDEIPILEKVCVEKAIEGQDLFNL